MARLSIVIPCLGDAAEFDGTLVSVLQNRPADCEVFVAHRHPYDDPYHLAGEVHFLHCEADSLAALINAALDEATGEIVHVLGCGLEATENWTEAPLAHFTDPDVASVSPLVFDSQDTLVAAGVCCSLAGARRVATDRRLIAAGSGRLRSRIAGPTLSASFYRSDCLAALGGFELAMTDQIADLALAMALGELGKLHVVEPSSRLIKIGEASVQTPARLTRALALERLFWRSAAHHSLPLILPLHAIHVATDCALELANLRLIPSLVGRAIGCLELGSLRRHQEQLDLARQSLAELARLRSARQTHRRLIVPALQERRKAA